jgi:hypothetical protein
MRGLASLLVGVVVILGCERSSTDLPLVESPSAGEPRLPFSIRTDQSTYVAEHLGGKYPYARYGFTLVIAATNTGTTTVFLSRCSDSSPPMLTVASAEPDVRSGYGHGWACVGADPLPFPPGSSRLDTVFVAGPNSWDGITKEPKGVLEGAFRVVYLLGHCDTCLIQPTLDSSPPFDVAVRWIHTP